MGSLDETVSNLQLYNKIFHLIIVYVLCQIFPILAENVDNMGKCGQYEQMWTIWANVDNMCEFGQ